MADVQAFKPLAVMVAPNGAAKRKSHRPGLPVTPAELARTAAECLGRGASVMHFHVRDRDGRHLLDAAACRAATAAIRAEVGGAMVLQITSESGGLYRPAEQMRMVRETRPEAVSVALREIMPDAAAELEAAAFFGWLAAERVMTQIILYTPEEVTRYQGLVRRGMIAETGAGVLFVLGRYTAGQVSDPADMLPFLHVHDLAGPWALCAFGRREAACMAAAAALGGHARVGFENNLYMPDGRMAADNAGLVGVVADGARLMGREPAVADEVRALWRAEE